MPNRFCNAPADSAVGGNGVYRYGPSGFPDSSWNSTSYWVDAVFSQTPPADTRPPKVASFTPGAGGDIGPVSSKVTVSFDEPLDREQRQRRLARPRDDQGAAVAATVTYDSQTKTATLTPTLPLRNGVTYTVTVRGGAGGVTDVAGNPLAADVDLELQHSAACPCTVYGPTDAPFGGAAQDQPLEVGVKLQADEDGWLSALRFYKQEQQHRHPRRTCLVRQRRAAGGGGVHGRDGVGVAAAGAPHADPDRA